MSDDGSRMVTEDFMEWWSSLPQPDELLKPPTIRIRFSKADIAVLHYGVQRLDSLEVGFRKDQIGVRVRYTGVTWPSASVVRNVLGGHYGQMVMSLSSRIECLVDNGGRVRLSVFEIAALILAARITWKSLRHGHYNECGIEPPECPSKELMAKLERFRKRAKRAFIAEHGVYEYQNAHAKWLVFVGWARLIMYCNCRQVVCPGQRRLRKFLLNNCIEVARNAHTERGLVLPPEPELRRLVRQAFARYRRGRGGLAPTTILKNQDLGGPYLADFITTRLNG